MRRAIRWKTHLALTWWPSVCVCSSVCSTIAYLNFFVLGKDFDGGSKEVWCGILIKCFQICLLLPFDMFSLTSSKVAVCSQHTHTLFRKNTSVSARVFFFFKGLILKNCWIHKDWRVPCTQSPWSMLIRNWLPNGSMVFLKFKCLHRICSLLSLNLAFFFDIYYR